LKKFKKIKDQFKDDKMGEAMRHKYAQEIKDKKKKFLDKQKKLRGGDSKTQQKNVKVNIPKGAAAKGKKL